MNESTAVKPRPRDSTGDGARMRLLAGLAVSERRRQLAGISTAVLEGGEGPPVVLLHGPGEFAATWIRVIPDLAATHRAVVPDLPGHGESGVGVSRLDADRMLAWLEELIERTCPSPPVLVGHLLGGAIAARFVVRAAHRVRGLVLVDGFGLAPFRPAPSFALAMIGFITWPNRRTQGRLFRGCFVDLEGLREEVGERWDALEAYALDRARTRKLSAALRGLMPHFAMRAIPPADLARISVPTTLIWGRHDLQVRLRVAEEASTRYGWPLHVIEGAADDPAVERPAEFLEALHLALGRSVTGENVS